MKITDFNKAITSFEGKKKELDIAQVSEVVRIVNLLSDGQLYKGIKEFTDEDFNEMVKELKKEERASKTVKKAKKKKV